MEEKQHFKILCVDGGGIKGLYSSQVLAEIEKAHNVCLSDYFDLICGTSTGGIIALGISAGIPMQKIVGFYQDCGPKIFRSNWKSLGVLGNVRYQTSFAKVKVLTEGFEKCLDICFRE